MSITFDSEKRIFSVTTENSSYIMGIAADEILTHIYYGAKVENSPNVREIYSDYISKSFSPSYNKENPYISTAGIYQEYPTFGSADYRVPALKAEYEDGTNVTRLVYDSYRIYGGKPALEGLPAVYTHSDEEAETLEITLKDKYSQMRVILLYSVIKGFDAVIRSARIVNGGKEKIKLRSALSASMDFYNAGFEITYLSGSWARERHIKKLAVTPGNFAVESRRGASSHILNPFIAISEAGANEKRGEVYGYSLVYSGSFIAGTETDEDSVRAYMGINPFNFCWTLEAGDSFQTPETVLVYSANGFGEMSRTYHRLYRTRLCRGKYRDTARPVLINNWEATYFDFNEEKILEIAKKAAECGIELMVLDDGWFGKRDNDKCSLGDWFVNYDKLPCGIDGLAKKVNALGLKFGLWFEPEMVSPDSELYRKHPDWCLHQKDRLRSESRNQLILDLSRKDVCDYIVKAVSDVLENANIAYVKWDYNRNMSEVGSALLDPERQGETAHRYMLGLYSVLERITSAFPDILFESCSGGGGRFDPGMMYYMPQAWTSDDTDAVERLYIQYGTSLAYASSMMGAHVSAVPNHQVGRVTPLDMRGLAAMCGRFGYELDLSKLTDEETETVKEQIKLYHKYENTVHKGDMYRLLSPFECDAAAVEYVSEDRKEVLFFYFNIKGTPAIPDRKVRLDGLDAGAYYRNTGNGEVYSGAALMNMGLLMPRNSDNFSMLTVFEKL